MRHFSKFALALLTPVFLAAQAAAVCHTTQTADFSAAHSDPEPIPEVQSLSNRLDSASFLRHEKLKGPEAITIVDGALFTGTREGRILKILPNEDRVFEIGNTGGVPLGLKMHPNGQLIIADAVKGLMMMNPEDGKTTLLTKSHGDIDFCLVDYVVVKSDGLIVFSVTTTRWHLKDFEFDALENRPLGMLVSYDLKAPEGQRVKILKKDLYFANGLALCPDEECLLYVETTAYRVSKNNFATGNSEVFADNMPGLPDNITCDDEMNCWVALVGQRAFAMGWSLLDYLHRHPGVMNFLYGMFKDGWISRETLVKQKHAARLAQLNSKGEISNYFQGQNTEVLHSITSAIEYEGKLYLGTFVNNWIAVLDLN
jgi:sugar lactone lactonase YvrE